MNVSTSCPACESDVAEPVQACPHCGFTIASRDSRFGPVPRYYGAIGDLSQILTPREMRSLLSAIRSVESRFPEVRIACVITRLRIKIPIMEFATWLFNRGNFSGRTGLLGENRAILFVFDTGNDRVATVVGYGLEPFLGRDDLRRILEDQADVYRRQGVAPALRNSIRALRTVLERNLASSRVP